MTKLLKITYLFESTTLWGGNKVALEQAEALLDTGCDITIVSKDSGPTWYPLRLPVVQVPAFDAGAIPESDIIVGTFWPTVKAAYEFGKGIPVHLCQGYEGGNEELLSQRAAIDEVYSYKIPKLIVSPHMEKFLRERFGSETYYVGQMLNHNLFYPSREPQDKKNCPFNILVVGPFEADVKNIPVALKGIRTAREKLRIPLRLIRVSQLPLSKEEEEITKPDVYHFHVPYTSMGKIYRNADLLVSTSKEAEGFGLPALEAMACGVPVILSRISSFTSFGEKQDYALFVEPMDVESVAKAIAEIVNSRTLREKLIRRGLEIAGKFTKEKVVERLQSAFKEIIRRDKLSRAKAAWNDYHINLKPGRKMHWWDSPVILEHCQRLVTGDPKTDIYRFLAKEFVKSPLERGLSICSGSGEFERGLLDNNICTAIDAYEIAEERVKEGIKAAQERNYAIEFYVEDVNEARFKKNHYDVFFSWSALHHIENLEGVCENVNNALKEKGLVVAQEYIGPNQFQWSDRQLEVINAVLSALPEGLRTDPSTGEVITRVERPAIEQMNRTDPSEAIRSKEIIPVLERFFKIKMIKYFGGPIFNPLFNRIVGNFDHEDERDVSLIRMILLLEEILIREKVLESDYAVIIAEKRQ